MAITIGSNLASLRAQRRLNEGSETLSRVYERLSSGQRINRASDDAAGLAIASSLQTDARVYTQGIRNLNDALSVTSIATGALQSLSSIVIRQRELATEAANGSYSISQRSALNVEANKLVDEFNRIVSVADFNGQKLLDGTFSNVRMQAGYGSEGSIAITIGAAFAGNAVVNFGNDTSVSSAVNGDATVVTDFNGDGNADVAFMTSFTQAAVYLGNGNGSFNSASYYGISNAFDMKAADLNGDGRPDLVSTGGPTGRIDVLINNGNGTFKARVSYSTLNNRFDLVVADFNNDLINDVIAFGSISGTTIRLGNGNGTFKAATSFPALMTDVCDGDFNNDGNRDLLSNGTILFGNGNATFQGGYVVASPPYLTAIGDINGDGSIDILTSPDNISTEVLLNNGNGTFRDVVSLAVAPAALKVADADGDGTSDIIFIDYNTGALSAALGNDDGSFRAPTVFPLSTTTATGVGVGDFNNDGIIDAFTTDPFGSTVDFVIGARGTAVPSAAILHQSSLDLTSASNARDSMSTLDSLLQTISQELGSLGGIESRINVALGATTAMRESEVAARARITDADIASDAAALTSAQILQQAAAAILAQASQQPALALQLLRGG